ncbi:helix-turn-helix domain-containing protein [Actinoplanes sp. NPDC089786]|uniref:helix-turn-helix domain-containing protein n=1 Tax=Actinoplanes sp. NPDC089786 TaxID=3155185 RepID=UPI003441F76E
MPALVFARRAVDGDELARVQKLAAARHAPADWVLRARIVTLSWSGLTVPQIARRVGCHPRTVRQRLHRFNSDGVPGLGDREGRGRPRRISEQQRSQIVALVKTIPPGRLRYDRAAEMLVQADETSTAAVWTLDALTETANAKGITVGRSQVRRILLADGARWRQVRSWALSKDPDFVPKGQPLSSCIPARPTTRRSSAPTNSAR